MPQYMIFKCVWFFPLVFSSVLVSNVLESRSQMSLIFEEAPDSFSAHLQTLTSLFTRAVRTVCSFLPKTSRVLVFLQLLSSHRGL